MATDRRRKLGQLLRFPDGDLNDCRVVELTDVLGNCKHISPTRDHLPTSNHPPNSLHSHGGQAAPTIPRDPAPCYAKTIDKGMNEIQKFLHEKSVEPYGIGMLTSSDAIEFVKLCMHNKIPIYGIDGFHRRVDKSPAAIQIDQRYSPTYAKVTAEEAYNSALNFLEDNKEDDTMLYQVIYEHVTPDYDIVCNYRTRL